MILAFAPVRCLLNGKVYVISCAYKGIDKTVAMIKKRILRQGSFIVIVAIG